MKEVQAPNSPFKDHLGIGLQGLRITAKILVSQRMSDLGSNRIHPKWELCVFFLV